jgi:hypothetical protein
MLVAAGFAVLGTTASQPEVTVNVIHFVYAQDVVRMPTISTIHQSYVVSAIRPAG